MSKILAIVGSGDLGQQIAHYAISDNHYDKVVFFDDFTEEKIVNGFRVLGNSNDIESEFELNSFDELIIGIGYKHLSIRKQLFDRFLKIIPFGKIVHSTSWIDSTAKIGVGCVIYPACVIDANASIGNNTILNVSCTVAHDTIVSQHCFLSPRVALAGFIKIEELCIIGINSTIIDNINIISGTQIGGGTVVIKDLQKKGLYIGNPHRFIR
ncbi:acetyltransferase [Flavobacterium chilense]|uniref:Sugar O-acyltransferase, sialic acid O-acetyltransferase NeuD family n=1 Tax=Flavobacterium chilense TaxID=946677 RepID=A0A1M7GSY6_9FLAO|nr:acetyltransferase [Flavobacterium chilense]SHM19275.1 sugar O-acyltransferase, sialic acid O-acetyltransferase NeuD family [Flavobacterium chilense]